MLLKKLELVNYRNIEKACLKTDDALNLLIGDNAQGKTNILEAIWYCSSAKSFRGAKEKDVVLFGEKEAKISAEFDIDSIIHTIDIKIAKNGVKTLLHNQCPLKKLSDVAGLFLSVIFTPEHLALVKEGPGQRRRFADIALCLLYPRYIYCLNRYNKTLEQKNAALRACAKNGASHDTLDIWDSRLAALGTEIIKYRREYISDIAVFAAEYHNKISEDSEKLEIEYEQSINAQTKEEYMALLLKQRKDDLFTGSTSAGIHRDDIKINLNGTQARFFASQGQQRSIVISLKLAEAKKAEEICRQKPIVLLDDILSELDKKRRAFILDAVEDYQVFLTGTECDLFFAGKSFTIKRGEVFDN